LEYGVDRISGSRDEAKADVFDYIQSKASALDDRIPEPYGVRKQGRVSLSGCQPNRVQANLAYIVQAQKRFVSPKLLWILSNLARVTSQWPVQRNCARPLGHLCSPLLPAHLQAKTKLASQLPSNFGGRRGGALGAEFAEQKDQNTRISSSSLRAKSSRR
jgi:hypothetical protein